MKITVQAHAKINWSLAVCGERENGYHDLDMLMQRIKLSDELELEEADRLTLRVDGQPADERNLVLRAAEALLEATGAKKGASISLRKRIPSRAGLGGGSADCAAALITLNELWKLELPKEELMRIGLALGADVPFCLQGGLARARGVGEILDPIPHAPIVPLAMVTPGGGLSTPEVFREWNRSFRSMKTIDNAALADALLRGDWDEAQNLSRNDLEPPAIAMMPRIAEIMDSFRALGARYVRMSGSGSTVFAVFDGDLEARNAAAQIPCAIATRTTQ